jgi:hypothetical protein
LVQALKPEDMAIRYEFHCKILARTENDLPALFIFSNEATFHTNIKVKWHKAHVWGTENPHVTLEHKRDSPKEKVFCSISKKRVYGSFFSAENTTTGNLYVDTLTLWLLPQPDKDPTNFIFQQDAATPHHHMAVWNHKNMNVP